MYLTTVAKGGATWIPYANCGNQNKMAACCGEYGLRIKPVKGSLVVIYDHYKEQVSMGPSSFDGLAAHSGCADNTEAKWAWLGVL